jgi:hypothetical protein
MAEMLIARFGGLLGRRIYYIPSSRSFELDNSKPQSKQRAEILIARPGGLLGRRIYYMLSSRSLKLDKSAAETMLEVLRRCRRTGGILLVQPEHAAGSAIANSHCTVVSRS